MSKVAVVYTTLPDEERAVALVGALLERRLVACGNMFPIRSVYRWKGGLHDEREVAVFLKAPSKRLKEVFAAVRELHPYETPCIEEWDVDDVLPAYAAWVVSETKAPTARKARKASAKPKRASAPSKKGPAKKARASRSRTRAR